jgi:hypothetical protein
MDNRHLLDQFAASLLDNEALDRDEIDLIMAGEATPPAVAAVAAVESDEAGANGAVPAAESNGHSTENSVPPPMIAPVPDADGSTHAR